LLPENGSSLASAGKPSSVTHLCGPVPARNADPESLFCALRPTREPNLLRGSAPGARKGFPAVFRAALVQTFAALVLSTPLHSAPRMGDTPPLALAAPAGVGQGQGGFVSKHSTAIQNGGTTHEHHPHHRYRKDPHSQPR